jgi:chaperonin cofactor prefoldin
VQDLAERISTLEGQVASLEEENGELRRRLGDVEARLQTWHVVET